MASIHVSEIRHILVERGQSDALPGSGEGTFLEILFDDGKPSDTGSVDAEFANKVITVESSQGSVTIIFNKIGMLESIEIC